jgi:peptide/nickel transport system substrate-binding protein
VLSANENKELRGGTLTALPVDVQGYGYIGINADTVNVGGNPSSPASKNLRRAFLTLFSAYREAAVGSYWGSAAYVIEYPICPVSWAAPQSGDEGYQAAYTVDAQGQSIVGEDMSAEQRKELALLAAVDFFKAAGYTWDEEQGKFTRRRTARSCAMRP